MEDIVLGIIDHTWTISWIDFIGWLTFVTMKSIPSRHFTYFRAEAYFLTSFTRCQSNACTSTTGRTVMKFITVSKCSRIDSIKDILKLIVYLKLISPVLSVSNDRARETVRFNNRIPLGVGVGPSERGEFK